EGKAWWKGTRQELLDSENPELNAFIFASGLMRKVKEAMRKG
ncbi:MAG: ABC transporter ATP-binding protein, partial [Flavobacteriales bacterium]|nr:ABC transporter ATP-binding protein [Flavobacteriales bacterium]